MATINLFKIDAEKVDEFREHMQTIDNNPTQRIFNEQQCTLYIRNERMPKSIKWHWAISNFNANNINTLTLPIGILEISVGINTYAISFGSAFYHIDKFCDKNFSFDIAKRFKYKKINSTAQANPNTNRSKTIISYVNSNYFEYDSGESFMKIKGKIQLNDDFTLFKENIEIGTSIKFDIDTPSVQKCIDLLTYLEHEIIPNPIITSIPVFIACSKSESEQYEEIFRQKIAEGNYSIRFADFDIIGTEETFYSNNTSYEIRYGRYKTEFDSLITEQDLRTFCEKRNLTFNDVLCDIQITAFENNSVGKEYAVRELIDYTDETNKCVLVSGKWYKYNDDYIDAINNMIAEIQIDENELENWRQEQYNAYIELKQHEYPDRTQSELKKTYYPEMVYNILMANDNGYENYDRQINNNVEICDLYKDETAYAVKIGSTSPKLGYAIDQSLAGMHEIRQGNFTNHTIKSIGLWFVLERNDALPRANNKPDLTSTRMLVLKNKLVYWLKEVRRYGYQPIINIGYKFP